MLGGPERVQAVLDDVTTAPIPEAEKALFAFVDKLNDAPGDVRREDVERLKAAGWSDEAIYDAVSVCALFNFYNRWIDGTGVQGLSPDLYAKSAKRMAAGGYLPAPPPADAPKPPSDGEPER
ncbi:MULTISPECIES: carboxymuconolactone decarboxylase family protein [Corallococcus]|uniref:carboxymuconolactone decarboxylase family protein n=1 Tax=Corallococcus TaxID=83461 RepID=UPI00117BE7AC|nr:MULTISPECIES: peroxidase [Corallococcus]NBD13571.1 peroxidase [Corallococcus silvisoli]TSC24582.1 peroxidase [Corallococcus sp. Z5C101001]